MDAFKLVGSSSLENLVDTLSGAVPALKYSTLLNEEDVIRDNTSAMLFNLPMRLEPATVYLAGLDGYQLNGNNYYLIDFLDSFIESPLLDLVKIRQDSQYEWSRLMYEGDVDLVRLSIISQKIDYEIDSYYSQYVWYREYYHVFQLMNFLRILQYAKEEKVTNYLKNVINSML